MVWAPPGQSAHTDFLVGVCRAAGVDPRLVVTPRQGMPPVTAVHNSDWVAFVTDEPGEVSGDAVVLELNPPVHMPVQVVWVIDALSRQARTLLERIRSHAGAANPQRVV